MQFTAGDWPLVPSINKKVYHHLKDVHLYYKNFLEPDWRQLDLQSHPISLDSLLGMPYSADLEPVLAQYPDSAWIDLKIELTDSTGNSNLQTIHPAFMARDAMTRIKPLQNILRVLIYSDPAIDKINVVTDEKNFHITIYTTNGQPLFDIFDRKEIDISILDPGLYILRIESTSDGRATYSKFIRK